MKNPHAVALGRKGGRVRSEAKKASGKLNMEKARAAKENIMKQSIRERIQPSLKHSAAFCTCGHGEPEHVGENFDNDPVHICTECDCKRFELMVR